MRTRTSIMNKGKIDYEYEASRPMCEGCEGCVYAAKPSMYVRADKCPRNPRRRPPRGGKVRVGQQRNVWGGR
jgi:hypothetical protein